MSTTADSRRALPGSCLYTKASARIRGSAALLCLGRVRNRAGSPCPSKATCTCAHAYTLSWQHPPWGEASTCPIPEQGAGAAARPQPGRPDSGERNEGGGHSCPGGLALEPGSRIQGVWRPLRLNLSTAVMVGHPRPRGDQGLPIGAASKARVDFILLEARQREVNVTLRWRRFTVLDTLSLLLSQRIRRTRNLKGRCELPSYK